MNPHAKLCLALTLIAAPLASSLHAQGSLSPPPGPPSPTMKTLDQIEARTAIAKSPDIPVAGPHFIISQPGSYDLTGNIQVASGNGINITASNVTLDLNGFALISTAAADPTSGNAINIAAGLTSIEIKNGRIAGGTVRTETIGQNQNPWDASFDKRGWYDGIQDTESSPSQGVILSHLSIEKCAHMGVVLRSGSSLKQITVTGNGSTGIHAVKASITNATAIKNGDKGIDAVQGSIINATAYNNGTDGIYADHGCVTNATACSNGSTGISAESGSVANATASSNGSYGISAGVGSVTNATVSSNGSDGIFASNGIVTNSRAYLNFRSGIYADEYGIVAHCLASGNSTDPDSVHKEIDANIVTGQRDTCIPRIE